MNLPSTGTNNQEGYASRLTLAWRNYSFRAEWKNLQPKQGFMTRYSSMVFFFLVFTLGLNILDSLFTMMIMDLKGREANPVVHSIITLYGSDF